MLRLVWVYLALLSLVQQTARAQGCSDAGICYAGLHEPDSELISSVGLSYTFGLGGVGIAPVYSHTFELEASLSINPKWTAQLKFPYRSAQGDLGSMSDLGDITLALSRLAIQKDSTKLSLVAGARIPGTNGSTNTSLPDLPMDYQSSLGSYDLLFSAILDLPKWRFALGYQQVLNRNANGFSHAAWTGLDSSAFSYFESAQLFRGNDLMARIQAKFKFKNSTLMAGFLPIFRLNRDEIILDDTLVALEGSAGLTLNFTLSYARELGERWLLKLTHGNPIIFRETRADGLTRATVDMVGLSYRF